LEVRGLGENAETVAFEMTRPDLQEYVCTFDRVKIAELARLKGQQQHTLRMRRK
jgi:hypothetical protein